MIRKKVTTAFGVFFLCLFQSTTHASPSLSTSGAWAFGQSYWGCTVTNVGTKPVRNVKIEILQLSGVVNSKTIDLAVNETFEVLAHPVGGAGSFSFCRFSGAKTFLRGALNVYGPGLNGVDEIKGVYQAR